MTEAEKYIENEKINMAYKKSVNIKITEAMRNDLETIAVKEYDDLTGIVRKAIGAFIRNYKAKELNKWVIL